jgi:CheY-like chemotaxis protein
MDLLVVDDEPLVRQSVVECLQDAGFEVSDAAHAEAALAVAAADGPPAVLVTDVNLKLGSGFCGIALAAVMRRRWPQLGVLYVTGHPECLTGRRLGARERCLAKPFSSAKLTRAVRDLMPSYDLFGAV